MACACGLGLRLLRGLRVTCRLPPLLGRKAPGPRPLSRSILCSAMWGVGMYRLRGQLSEAEEMQRRLGHQ